jgi:ADP-L-glycero-D-manno-heptose 6-epimerase
VSTARTKKKKSKPLRSRASAGRQRPSAFEVFEGSEDIKRDFVHVDRVIEIHRRFFDLDVSGVYNLGTGVAMSFMDVARTVARETGAEIVEVPMPKLKGYQRFTQADMTKTNALL